MVTEIFPYCSDELAANGLVAWGTTQESKPTELTLNKNEDWVNRNQNGELNYLVGDRFNLRQDIKNYFPEFKEAIVFLFSYKNTKKWIQASNSSDVKIASYALGFNGLDYHVALGNSLEKVKSEIAKTHPHIVFKTAIDMHPVFDRDLAYKAGLGWFGKNSMLINRKEGSYFMIASLLLSEAIINKPQVVLESDHCGTCTRCIEACPTDAIDGENRTINASLCISTHTIEYFAKKEIAGYDLKMPNEVFGCDICQDVCPHNVKLLGRTSAIVVQEMSYAFKKIVDFFYGNPRDKIIEKLNRMSNKEYKNFFFQTSFFRSGKRGILKNFF